MTVASAMRINRGVIEEVRMAVNGAAPYPIRLEDSERIVRGQAPSDALGLRAGEVRDSGRAATTAQRIHSAADAEPDPSGRPRDGGLRWSSGEPQQTHGVRRF